MKTKGIIVRALLVLLGLVALGSVGSPLTMLISGSAQQSDMAQNSNGDAPPKADGRLALAAAGNEQPEIRAGGGEHFAVSPRYAARFDGAAIEITGHKRNADERGPTVRFQLSEVRKGSEVLASSADDDPSVQAGARRITYARRSGIVERYDVLERGIEQSFVLTRRARGQGDLILAGLLNSDQWLGESLPDGSGGLVIALGDTAWKLHYGAVTAIDATGLTQPASLAIAGGQVTITLDGDWLARAAYPVVIDPLIYVERDTKNQGRPVVAFDPGYSPSARPPRYFVAYEQTESGKKEIFGKILDKNGTIVVAPFNISSDATVDDFNPTITFKYGAPSAPLQNYLVAWQRSDGWLVYRLYDRNGAAITPTTYITRGKDPDAAASPYGARCGFTWPCEPYQIAYRYTESVTNGSFSKIGLASVDPSIGSLLSYRSVEDFGSFVDDPSYAPHIAYGHSGSSNSNYFVLTYRRPSGQIVARKVSTGGLVYSPFEVTTSSSGAPVVAYSYGANRWAMVWRQSISYRVGGGLLLKCQLYDSNAESLSLAPYGSGITVASVSDQAVLTDYAVAGSQTTGYGGTGQAFFQVSYVQGAMVFGTPRDLDVFSKAVLADNTLGSLTTVYKDPGSPNVNDTAVKFAHVKIDIPGLPVPADCDGSGPNKRCALWIWEHHYSATDHDIYGYVTTSEY
jgi:hypothetical protein